MSLTIGAGGKCGPPVGIQTEPPVMEEPAAEEYQGMSARFLPGGTEPGTAPGDDGGECQYKNKQADSGEEVAKEYQQAATSEHRHRIGQIPFRWRSDDRTF